MRRFLSFLACSALTAAAVPTANAATITYTESAIGSGTFDGAAFTSALVTFSGSGDTANVQNPSSGIFRSILPTTVTIAGLHTDTLTDTIQFVDNQGLTLAGVGDVTTNAGILFTVNSVLGTYGVTTALGPILGANSYNSGRAFATSGGSLSLDIIFGNSTFQANVPTIAATPEPSSLLLLATGSLGLAGAMRRRLTSRLAR